MNLPQEKHQIFESFQKTSCAAERESIHAYLLALVEQHPCSHHPLFSYLANARFRKEQLVAVLRNYDAHASVLRRLLLNAAAIMPEEAVGYVLENVRNEYGNGDYSLNHQAQLRDLACRLGVSGTEYSKQKIQTGVRRFIKEATSYYQAKAAQLPVGMKVFAVTAGAITATELLAMKEFAALQKAFLSFDLAEHIWFQHLSLEAQHSDDSVALALHCAVSYSQLASVEYGLSGVLNANIHLYDGLLASCRTES